MSRGILILTENDCRKKAGHFTFDISKYTKRAFPGFSTLWEIVVEYLIEGSLEAKLPTICKDGNGTARKKLRRGES